MALTAEQLQKERDNEAKLNELSDKIIGYTPFGQLYPLMRLAASIGEGSIPHKICVDADGRTVTVYKGTAGKLVGSWLKPTHEYITNYLSKGDYLNALLSTQGWWGQMKNYEAQKKATCITITPNEIINLVNSVPSRDPNTGLRRATTNTNNGGSDGSSTSIPLTTTQQFFNSRNLIITLSIAGAAGLLFGILKFGKVI